MKLVKVMRYHLVKPENDRWETVGPILRRLQRETRTLLNKTIQLAWEWQGFASDYKNQHGEYPKTKDVVGYSSLHGHAYNVLKNDFQMIHSSNASQTIKRATDKWKSDVKDILRGDKSIPSFRKDCPIDVVSAATKVEKSGTNYIVSVSLIGKAAARELARKNGQFRFLIHAKDGTQRSILDRIIESEYKLGASQIVFHKNKWLLNLCYQFEKEKTTLDPDTIMGVDLGIAYPVYLAFNNSWHRYSIKGNELLHFRRQTEKRRKELQEQGKYCGEGRRSRGVQTRIQPIYTLRNKISNFRDTTNHKYARFVIDMALKHGCGTIQMEELKSIAADNTFLKNWPYYDLQQKIEYKAREHGITIVYIDRSYTSQRCSKCGHIDKNSRQSQAVFQCTSCGFEAHADYNAARNIATPGIEQLIAEALK